MQYCLDPYSSNISTQNLYNILRTGAKFSLLVGTWANSQEKGLEKGQYRSLHSRVGGNSRKWNCNYLHSSDFFVIPISFHSHSRQDGLGSSHPVLKQAWLDASVVSGQTKTSTNYSLSQLRILPVRCLSVECRRVTAWLTISALCCHNFFDFSSIRQSS